MAATLKTLGGQGITTSRQAHTIGDAHCQLVRRECRKGGQLKLFFLEQDLSYTNHFAREWRGRTLTDAHTDAGQN